MLSVHACVEDATKHATYMSAPRPIKSCVAVSRCVKTTSDRWPFVFVTACGLHLYLRANELVVPEYASPSSNTILIFASLVISPFLHLPRALTEDGFSMALASLVLSSPTLILFESSFLSASAFAVRASLAFRCSESQAKSNTGHNN